MSATMLYRLFIVQVYGVGCNYRVCLFLGVLYQSRDWLGRLPVILPVMH